MRSDGPRTETTTERDLRSQITGRLQLLVMGDGSVVNHPLPDSGEVIIGRAPNSDIRIDDAGISRRHARLTIGPVLQIEDLESSNGVRVRGERLTKGEVSTIRPDETFELGGFIAIVQHRTAPLRMRRMWSHDYFEGRLADECARATRSGASFVLLRIHGDGPASTIPEVLGRQLRAIDVFGLYAPGEYEVLLIDTSPLEAQLPIQRIVDELAHAGVQARCGIASFPTDGRDPDSLVAKASAAASGRDEVPAAGTIVVEGAMQNLQRLIERIAAGTLSVLILGETGVGKEVLAETVHRLSPRADKPLLKLNCAALSETLLESELFGHERGAFTGAVVARTGLLESAQGGSVFIDEVGDLPLSIQVKLLRVIEERMVLPVGAVRPRRIDVRFIAATNRDLEAEVRRGAFRQDLLFRLNAVTVTIPPLRERASEIASLAEVFIPQACREAGRTTQPILGREALALLIAYSWPGNIRELRNVIQRAVLLCGAEILVEHLPVHKIQATFTASSGQTGDARSGPRMTPPPAPAPDEFAKLEQTDSSIPRLPAPPSRGTTADSIRGEMQAIERQRILEVLDKCAGNQTRAAKLLGVSRRTLVNRIEAYDLPRPRKARAEED